MDLDSRGKRVDFLSAVLMFDAQREPDGSDGSPECAVSTLLAPPPRDQDPEEASRTLVLVSAGNGAVSPGDGQGTLGAVTPQATDEPDRGALTFVPRPGVAAAGRSSSPPLAKVERTFVHIAETTHRIVMTTGKQTQRGGRGEEPAGDAAEEPKEEEPVEEKGGSVAEGRGSSEEEIVREKVVQEDGGELEEEGKQEEENVTDEAKKENGVEEDEEDSEDEAKAPSEKDGRDEEQEVDQDKEALSSSGKLQEPEPSPDGPKESPNAEPGTLPRAPQPRPRRRSRIPVLISEEETGSDQSSSPKPSPRTRRTRQPQLARLVLERKRSTQSTTASEDDTHRSDEPIRPRAGQGATRSRIPRPVTPIKKPFVQSGSETLPQTQRSVSFIQPSPINSGIQKSASAHSSIHQQKPRPQLRTSKTLPPRTPQPAPALPRTALRGVSRSPAPTNLRPVSGASRTNSPSPQRFRHAEPRSPAAPQTKSRPQDSTQRRARTNPAAAPQKVKREAAEAKSKGR